MKDILFHLSKEELQDQKSFVLFFLCAYKHSFLSLHIWLFARSQLWSMTLLWCCRNKIDTNYENSSSSSYSLVLDSGSSSYPLVHYHTLCCLIDLWVNKGLTFFWGFIQKKICVKIQHQVEVSKPILWHLNWQRLQEWEFWTFILDCLTERDGIDRMFHF